MAIQSKNTIKKVYDVYKPSDYELGEESSTNLNPKREIDFSKIEIVRKRLQEITDDIIRRKIVVEEEVEEPISISLSPGALPDKNSLLRQAAQINAGSIGLGVLFPIIDGPFNGIQNLLEPIIGSFPAELLLDELDHPLSLDCKEILKQYDFAEVEDVEDDSSDEGGEDNEDSEEEDSDEEDSEEEGESGEPEPESESDEDQSDFEACALIEMDFLKIILILLRIIKIIQTILDLILAIIVPLLEIVLLALMCWIIPPAAEQLRQRITEMVMAIIIMIITRLLQMIFNLLNLDCLCDQIMEVIAQIRQALSAFSSIMSVFNVESVNMLAKNISSQLQKPLDQMEQMEQLFKNKKEAWDKMKEEWGNLDLKDMAEKTKEQIRTGVINAVSTDPNVQKITQTATAAYNFMKDDIKSIISGLNKIKNSLKPPAVIPESGASETSMLNNFDVVME
jgi:hypothetical protein